MRTRRWFILVGFSQFNLYTILEKESVDVGKLNDIYTATAKLPLCNISSNGIVGFKMRFMPSRISPPFLAAFSPWRKLYKKVAKKSFRSMMIDLLRRNDVVAFMAIRQDTLRWGLSKYHGDGTGKGQAALANHDELGL